MKCPKATSMRLFRSRKNKWRKLRLRAVGSEQYVVRYLVNKRGYNSRYSIMYVRNSVSLQLQNNFNKYIVPQKEHLKESEAIAHLKRNATRRGLRHAKKLPVRGQRSRTNARSKKGPRAKKGKAKV